MQILKTVQNGVSDVVNYVADRNRKASLISRVKRMIREEERKANEAYISLGRYYYQRLRDPENSETEFYCEEVDEAVRRLQRAELKLGELTKCENEIYNFDDESFEEFCRECTEDAEAAAAKVPTPEGIIPDDVNFEEEGIDVEFPAHVKRARDVQNIPAQEASVLEERLKENGTAQEDVEKDQ